MNWLLAGLIIFFAVHSISIVNEPWLFDVRPCGTKKG